jgi:1-deoxy-D-xylulose-5-phosphate reductoisomerase
MRRKVLILGCTGSIGTAALEVIESQDEAFEVFGLACKGNVDLLNAQIERFRPEIVCVYDEGLKERVELGTAKLCAGERGMEEMIRGDADIVVNALPGSMGLNPTVEALKHGKVLALANKESLVMAGRIIRRLLGQSRTRLIPVDSEHSALYQLMEKVAPREIRTLTITASGGPFRNHKKEDLEQVRVEEALNHPTWKMGAKITLDSATLMNKGLEVIEAKWLFDVDPSRIRVLVHPESIVHGIIELTDNSFFAYMAYPDMRIPISFAMNGGERRPLPFTPLHLEDVPTLSFYPPDLERFPSLRLAYDALAAGDGAVVAMNAANEAASEAFLRGRIKFTDIPGFIEDALDHHPRSPVIEEIETVWQIHRWAQNHTEGKLRKTYD